MPITWKQIPARGDIPTCSLRYSPKSAIPSHCRPLLPLFLSCFVSHWTTSGPSTRSAHNKPLGPPLKARVVSWSDIYYSGLFIQALLRSPPGRESSQRWVILASANPCPGKLSVGSTASFLCDYPRRRRRRRRPFYLTRS